MAHNCHDRPFSSATLVEAEEFLQRLEMFSDCKISRDPAALGCVGKLIEDTRAAERARIFRDPNLKIDW